MIFDKIVLPAADFFTTVFLLAAPIAPIAATILHTLTNVAERV